MDIITDVLTDVFVPKKSLRFSNNNITYNYNARSRIATQSTLPSINETPTVEAKKEVATLQNIPLESTLIIVEKDRPLNLFEIAMSNIKFRKFSKKIYIFTDVKDKYQKHLLKNPNSKYTNYEFVDNTFTGDNSGIVVYDFGIIDIFTVNSLKSKFKKLIVLQDINVLCNISNMDSNTYIVFNRSSISTCISKIKKIYNKDNTIPMNMIEL